MILPDDAYDLWLDPGFNNLKELASLLVLYEAKLMRRYAVSTSVNSEILATCGPPTM